MNHLERVVSIFSMQKVHINPPEVAVAMLVDSPCCLSVVNLVIFTIIFVYQHFYALKLIFVYKHLFLCINIDF